MSSLYGEWSRVAELMDPDEQVVEISQMVAKLPRENQAVLCDLMHLLNEIDQRFDQVDIVIQLEVELAGNRTIDESFVGAIGAHQRGDFVDGFSQFIGQLVFGDVTGGAGFQRLRGQCFAAVRRHQDDWHARVMEPHGGDQIQSVDIGHL